MSDQRTQELGEEDFCGGGEEEVGADKEIGAENDEEVGANKRIKEMSIDRITALPDSLLVRILSSLNTKEAATTSVLSKRWQFLWIDLPCLKFCESSTENEKIRQFVASVNRTLVICNGRDLQKFEVDFSYDRCFASDVNVWVEFAVFNKVRDVSLLLNSSSCEDFYMLPQMMFSNSFIRRLSMRRCTMAPLRSVEWKSLTSLFIEEVELTQHVIEKILSGCPVLSNLLLKACWGFSRLEISQKLCALGVVDREDGKNEPLLEISAPHVDSFIIKHYPKGRHLRLTNIPSLTKTYFDFNGSDWDASSEEAMSNMKHILESIQHVQELELGCRCIEVISMLVVNGWQLPQSRRWGLIVNASSDEHHISGIIALLESSPNLEILVIDGYEPSGASVTLGPATRRDLDCDLLHLKTVQIIIFDLIGEPLLTIAQSLLKRAPILERMIINVEEFMRFTSRGSTSSDFNKLSAAVKIGETLINLLKYPKSSQNAVVLLR